MQHPCACDSGSQLEDLINYADDNYIGSEHEELETAIQCVITKTERIFDWLTNSGLKINDSKTQIRIFHRRNLVSKTIKIKNSLIQTQNTITILGMTFDSKLNWNEHIQSTIKSPNSTLYAIRMIKKYFNPEEVKTLLTSLYYSKLYYGAEIWHIPGLSRSLQNSLKLASANALKLCIPRTESFLTHTEIHKLADRCVNTGMQ